MPIHHRTRPTSLDTLTLESSTYSLPARGPYLSSLRPSCPHVSRPHMPLSLRPTYAPLLMQAFTSKGFQYLTETYLPRKLREGDWV